MTDRTASKCLVAVACGTIVRAQLHYPQFARLKFVSIMEIYLRCAIFVVHNLETQVDAFANTVLATRTYASIVIQMYVRHYTLVLVTSLFHLKRFT